jgi:hypothetical protein
MYIIYIRIQGMMLKMEQNMQYNDECYYRVYIVAELVIGVNVQLIGLSQGIGTLFILILTLSGFISECTSL